MQTSADDEGRESGPARRGLSRAWLDRNRSLAALPSFIALALRTLLAGIALMWTAAAAHADVLDEVGARSALIVCIWPEYYGITWRNPRDLTLSGIDIDLAKALASELGVSAQFIDSSFAHLIEDVTQRRCDIAMFGIGVTPERASRLLLTEPHLASDVVAIVHRRNKRIRTWIDIDRTGVLVAVTRGTYHEPLMRARLKRAELLVAGSARARDESVEAGRADVFMTDAAYARRMIDTTDWARAITPASPFQITSYAFAIRPGEERWLNRVNAFVRRVKLEGDLLESAKRHGLESMVIAP